MYESYISKKSDCISSMLTFAVTAKNGSEYQDFS